MDQSDGEKPLRVFVLTALATLLSKWFMLTSHTISPVEGRSWQVERKAG